MAYLLAAVSDAVEMPQRAIFFTYNAFLVIFIKKGDL
jgi:hypothetical protein